jgi:hypothetical protein
MGENLASPLVWWAVVVFLIFCGLVYASAWLRGSRWFAATMLCLGATFVLLSADILGTGLNVKAVLGVSIFGWVCTFFFYVIAGHHLTQTKVLDLTYGSHHALAQYLTKNSISSWLARTVRLLPWVLGTSLVVLVAFGYWAKTKGMLA